MQYAHYALAGLCAGVIGSVLGVGGGILLVPLFLYIFELPIDDATATSLAVIIFIAISATVRQSTVDWNAIHWEIAIPVAIAAIVGAFLGVGIKESIPTDVLQKLFAVFLMLVAIQTWFK